MKRTTSQPVDVITDICCDACGASVVPEFQKEHLENLDGFNEFAYYTVPMVMAQIKMAIRFILTYANHASKSWWIK